LATPLPGGLGLGGGGHGTVLLGVCTCFNGDAEHGTKAVTLAGILRQSFVDFAYRQSQRQVVIHANDPPKVIDHFERSINAGETTLTTSL
jgi:hypothetical protein